MKKSGSGAQARYILEESRGNKFIGLTTSSVNKLMAAFVSESEPKERQESKLQENKKSESWL